MTVQVKTLFIPLRELVKGFTDDGEGGVTGFDGKLIIRPPYQRDFVYDLKRSIAVIDTVSRGQPLNLMHWADRGDGTYEVLDGQQRTISICQYVNHVFSVNGKFFGGLHEDQQKEFLDYEVWVAPFSGTESEKLDWFRRINISGMPLNDQEILNSAFHGTWLDDAKSHLSRATSSCAKLSNGYVTGAVNRQELLETALKWVCVSLGVKNVEEYMSRHRHDGDSKPLRDHYERVLEWAKATFPIARKELRTVDWGTLFHKFGHVYYSGSEMEKRVAQLMADEDVTNKKGIYAYVLDGQYKHLSIRSFSPNQRREAYESQQGLCPACRDDPNAKDKRWALGEMEADHITPWSRGGRTNASNCQMLCKDHNRRKSDI